MHLFKVWTAALLVAQGVLHHSAVAAPTPEDVQKLAHIYAKAHPGEKAHWGDSLTEEYSLFFFNGFLYGGGTAASKARNLLEEAHAQGAARWRQGSEARQRTFAGYGYQRVELSGTWRSSFETSRFEAEGMREACWLAGLCARLSVGPTQSDG